MVIDGRSALPLATTGTQEFVLRKKTKNYLNDKLPKRRQEDLCREMRQR